MASQFYTFIATKTTYTRVVPPVSGNQADFVRRVASVVKDIAAGTLQVGELKQFPLPDSVPNHLLCDGSEVEKISFPELYTYLGDSQGASSSADNFKLPNYVGTFTPAPTAPAQTVEGGTVSTGGTVTEPTQPGETGGTVGGNIPSGGRLPRSPNEQIE